MVKCAVVGLGRFGRLHSLTLDGIEGAELVGVVARRPESVEALNQELPEVPGFTDLTTAIEKCDAEAWIVACTTSEHVHVTQQLLEAGKHVLLEKPISEDMDEAMSLATLIEDEPNRLMIGHILLFNSEFKQLRAEANRRGGLHHIDAVRHRPASIVKEFAGENPLHAAMVHDLYCAQVLVNGEEPREISCQYHLTSDGEIDLANAQVLWPSGVVGRFAASYFTPPGMAPRGIDRTEVFGDGWAARIEPNPRPIELWSDVAEWPMALEIMTDEFGVTGMMAEEQRCFLRVVRGEQSVPLGARYEDALQVQRWMDTMDKVAVR